MEILRLILGIPGLVGLIIAVSIITNDGPSIKWIIVFIISFILAILPWKYIKIKKEVNLDEK